MCPRKVRTHVGEADPGLEAMGYGCEELPAVQGQGCRPCGQRWAAVPMEVAVFCSRVRKQMFSVQEEMSCLKTKNVSIFP